MIQFLGGHVWKRVWILEARPKTFFGLEWGQDLENRAAHPHQEFPRVPPRACPSSCKPG